MCVGDTDLSLVIFADIDGLLSTVPRTTLVKELRTLEELWGRAAVVLCSGRTRPEIEHLSQELGSTHPFICEHGAATFVPLGYFPFEVPNAVPIAGYQAVEFGRSAGFVQEVLRRTAERLGVAVRSFSEMSVEEVAQDCGLSLLCARLAKLRDYGELFRVLDPRPDVRARLLDALRSAHLRCIGGGRYDHVGGSVDISVGVGMLRTMYRRLHVPSVSVGVVDWQADGDLLQLVECAIVIEGPESSTVPRTVRKPQHVRVRSWERGNWAEKVVEIVSELYAAPPRL